LELCPAGYTQVDCRLAAAQIDRGAARGARRWAGARQRGPPAGPLLAAMVQ